MKGLWLKTLLLVASMGFALLVAERTLRWVGWEYRPMTVQVQDREDARGFHLFRDESFVYDSRLIWRPRAGMGVFNSQGLRGPELTRVKPTDEVRIIAIGDSNTLGWAGEEGANWPADLDDRLRELGRPATVVNAGVWGYASYQGLVRLEEVLPYEPDIVTISFGSNDGHYVARTDEEFLRGSHRLRRLKRWLTHYRLGQLVAASFQRGPAGAELRPRVSLERYRDNLRAIVKAARTAGVVPVFLTRPFNGEIEDPLWWKNFGYDYNAATVEVAAAEQVLVVDLYTYFKGRDRYFSDESHFTADGHRLAAHVVADHLRPLLEDL